MNFIRDAVDQIKAMKFRVVSITNMFLIFFVTLLLASPLSFQFWSCRMLGTYVVESDPNDMS